LKKRGNVLKKKEFIIYFIVFLILDLLSIVEGTPYGFFICLGAHILFVLSYFKKIELSFL